MIWIAAGLIVVLFAGVFFGLQTAKARQAEATKNLLKKRLGNAEEDRNAETKRKELAEKRKRDADRRATDLLRQHGRDEEP